MKRTLLSFLFISILSFMVRAQAPVKRTSLDNYNITWDSQSKNSAGSMPLVGGDIGCNVWVEDGEILFYVQRSGSLSENGEYLKLGRVRIKISPNPFEIGSKFSQKLNLEQGNIIISGVSEVSDQAIETKVNLWVDIHQPVVHVEVSSEKEVDVEAYYENWRIEDKPIFSDNSKSRWGMFNLEGFRDTVVTHQDQIDFENEGEVMFFHKNPRNALIPEVLIKQQGLEEYRTEITDDINNRVFGGLLLGTGFVSDGVYQGEYLATPFKAWKIKSSKAAQCHEIMVVSHIAQVKDLEDWKKGLSHVASRAKSTIKESKNATLNWWEAFWDKSYINIFPDRPDTNNEVWQAGRNYQLFRYQLGGNAYGEYPTKFNGGNLTFDPVMVESNRDFGPDWRAWGGATFTAQNQRLLYWPLLKTGDFEAMLPQFELYRKGLGGAEARVKKNFGHEGGIYSEYMAASGLAMGAGYGWENGTQRNRGEEISFGDPRADALRGYDEPVEKGVMANSAISYHWESQVEHAYMILEYHRFSGNDISAYIPFIKSALVFFDKHYQKRQQIRDGNSLDENGKLVLYPSTSCESYRGAKNPVDLISGLRASIKSILALNSEYFTEEERSYFEGYLERLPGYFYSEVAGDQILNPAESWERYQNVECPQFYPLFPFNQFHLGKDDMTVFKQTWKHGDFPKDMVISWHQDGIFFARMGMTKEAAEYNVKKLKDSDRRFPTFWGPGHDWVPDHNWGGSGMIGLQEMLMQTFEDKIYLFPAWPKDWDVEFKLHAPKQTTVEGKVERGKLIGLKVSPAFRINDVVIMNEYE
ncbi:DUF5703 domain-containing protein [Echinicola salinicaeni]|uniref:DUF5703 domain-containing protein n=1 Tax=Echinicola salinicaeni TaxID=2762757 RepID=UPI001646619C|nr:DUF5703 domain-containing protein [Echinicola salinicaeni]